MEYFIEKYEDFPSGKLLKHESPDFILKTSRKYKIGIELTQIRSKRPGKPQKLSELIEEMNRTIEKKEGKLHLYESKQLNEYWLIIYMDDIGLRITNNLTDKLNLLVSNSGFDRLWLFDLFGGILYEIIDTKNN